ncbi:MAG: hypothetical protein U0800_25155 [Isosphaeraceae bacterium]
MREQGTTTVTVFKAPPCAQIVALGLVACALAPASAPAQEGKVTVETVEYKGWKNALKISNGDVELIATLDVGPRILSYKLAGGKNVLKEYEDQLGKSGESEWMIRGGHRLWTSPEDLTRTYAPDNAPVRNSQPEPGVIRLTPPPDERHGIQKEIDIKLAPRGCRVTLVHRIKNIGKAPTDLAPWALTVMAPGGLEIIPLPGKKPHPGAASNAKGPEDFAPNQSIILWPFFDFKDTRWTFGTKYITLKQSRFQGATKLGLDHRMGWVGYLNGGTLFVKRFDRITGEAYPDRGTNFQTFTNEDMLEIESLGPAIRLGAGLAVEHVERWELHGGIGEVGTEADADAKVLPVVGPQ